VGPEKLIGLDVSKYLFSRPDNKYLLIAIDTFSRYLSVVPLINKSSKSVIAGFKQIFSKGRKPKWLRADHGGEFDNRWLKQYLKSEDVGILRFDLKYLLGFKVSMHRCFHGMSSFLGVIFTGVSSLNDRCERLL
jgi:hypothetical protein